MNQVIGSIFSINLPDLNFLDCQAGPISLANVWHYIRIAIIAYYGAWAYYPNISDTKYTNENEYLQSMGQQIHKSPFP